MDFIDLSQYTYKLSRPLTNVFNVGWLGKTECFSNGVSSDVFVEKLKYLIVGNVSFDAHFNRVRGIHPCNLCGAANITVATYGREEVLGMSEILVPSQQADKYYAAPAMIYHYISEHNYLPPEDFVTAVLAVDLASPYLAEEIFDFLLMHRQG